MSSKKSEVPTMYLEVLNQMDSGYVRDDTKGTAHEERISTSSLLFIPTTGTSTEPVIDEKTGQPNGYRNIRLRYIKNCPYIRVDEQEANGWKPNRIPSTDAIVLKKGKAIVKKEGDRLYDYLHNVSYNLSSPNRVPSAKALFRVVELEKNVTVNNEHKFIKARAITYVESLVLKTGTNSYKYNEDKIDSILTLLNVFGGENYSEKINSLTHAAEVNPVEFLKMVTKADDILTTEVNHALELGVIKFNGNTVEDVDTQKVFAVLGKEKMSNDKKITALSELLRTPEYASVYQEIKTKTELAQEKSLTK